MDILVQQGYTTDSSVKKLKTYPVDIIETLKLSLLCEGSVNPTFKNNKKHLKNLDKHRVCFKN